MLDEIRVQLIMELFRRNLELQGFVVMKEVVIHALACLGHEHVAIQEQIMNIAPLLRKYQERVHL